MATLLLSKGNSPPITVADVSRVIRLFGLSSLAVLMFAFFLAHADWILAVRGAMGCVAAFVGAGVGLWAAFRMRSAPILRATLPALVAFVG